MEILLPRSARRWRADALKTPKFSTAIGSIIKSRVVVVVLQMVLLQQLMQVATQPSPLKAAFSRDDIELAAVALVQHLIASSSRPSQSVDHGEVVEPRRSSYSDAAAPPAPSSPASSSSAAAAAAAAAAAEYPAAAANDAAAKHAAGGRTQRRHRASPVRPMLPVVGQLMEMGFARRKAEAAVKHLGIRLSSFTSVL